VTDILFGEFEGGASDATFLSGGKVYILRSSSSQLIKVSLPVSAKALAIGNFVNDHVPGLQLALLSPDGSIHIAVHREFDPRAYTDDELKEITGSVKLRTEENLRLPIKTFPTNGWKIVENIPATATFSAGQVPVMLRTRISDHQMDDVMLLDGARGQLTVVQHPDVRPGDINFGRAVLSTRPYSGDPIAAIPARINIDGRAGVLAIHKGEAAPSMLMPLPDPTFVVNTTTDLVSANPHACLNAIAGQCSLRQAILEANATAGADTITVPAGT